MLFLSRFLSLPSLSFFCFSSQFALLCPCLRVLAAHVHVYVLVGGPDYEARCALMSRLVDEYPGVGLVAVVTCGAALPESSTASKREAPPASPSASRSLPVAEKMRDLLLRASTIPESMIHSSPYSSTLLEDLLFARRFLLDLGDAHPPFSSVS